MIDLIKPDRPNWRHYFGSLAFLVLILQLLTGIIMTLFYDPTYKEAYKSVQYLTNEVTGGSLARNLHRWIALSLFIFVLVHFIRTTFRKDFLNPLKKVEWLTGVLLILPTYLLIYTGLILPWEWKGYWFMELIPSYAATLPIFGPSLKSFLMQSFTLPRYLVIHILLLPIIYLVLVDYHLLTKLRKRGIFRHILRHTVISLPIIIILVVLSTYITIPSLDPMEIPMPLEGEYIPQPEWWALTLLLPFLYFKGFMVPLLSIFIPIIALFAVAFLPYYLKTRAGSVEEAAPLKTEEADKKARWWKVFLTPILIRGAIVTAIALVFCALIYKGSYNSPTLGCNSCHNLSRGFRMGLPPDTFKDRNTLPNLDDNKWMLGHWYYPNEVF